MSRLIELAKKMTKRAKAATTSSERLQRLLNRSNTEVRLGNLPNYNPMPATDMEIDGVEVGDLYSFAFQHHYSSGENILNAPLSPGDSKTLLWSFSNLANLIDTRKMTKPQYDCLREAVMKYKAQKEQ